MTRAPCWLIGCAGAGKTTLALALALDEHRATNTRVLIVDGEGDARLRGAAARNLDELLEHGARSRIVRYRPMLDNDSPRVARYLADSVPWIVVVDGAHTLLSAHAHASDDWVRLNRIYRHARLSLYWTTHYLGGDVPQIVQATAPELFVFRTTSPASLQTLEHAWGLPQHRVRSLNRGEYLHICTGFPEST